MPDKEIDREVAEQLSALVDGELGKDERTFLLKRLGHDEAARARLGRYYMIRDALQRNLPAQQVDGLADRVREAVAAEGEHRKRSHRGWARPAMGTALAGAVAALTVTWWQGQAPVGMQDPMSGETVSAPAGIPDSVIDFPSVERFTAGARESLLPAAAGRGASAPAVQEFIVPEPMHQQWDTVGMDELSPRLRELMVDHAEHAASGGIGGMLDYIRFAGHAEGE